MEQILIKLSIPVLEKTYDVWIPAHKKVYNVIMLLIKAINELNDNCYNLVFMPSLYDKFTGEAFDNELTIKENDIKTGAELILM